MQRMKFRQIVYGMYKQMQNVRFWTVSEFDTGKEDMWDEKRIFAEYV